MTMLVSTSAGSSSTPSSCASPSARRRALDVVLGEPLDVVVERVQAGGREDPRLAHRAAEHLLAAPGLVDQGLRAGQAGADGRSQPLREVEPRGVEAAAPTSPPSTPLATTAFMQPGAVQVRAQPVAGGDVEHAARLRLERPHAPAARGSSSARRTPLAGAGRSGRPHGSPSRRRRAPRARTIPRSPSTTVMTSPPRAAAGPPASAWSGWRCGAEQHLVAAGRTCRRDRDLVAHRPRRQEDGGLVAEQLGDALLQSALTRRVLAALLVADLGGGHGARMPSVGRVCVSE